MDEVFSVLIAHMAFDFPRGEPDWSSVDMEVCDVFLSLGPRRVRGVSRCLGVDQRRRVAAFVEKSAGGCGPNKIICSSR